MDVVVKMDRFQILQNALKVKYTLVYTVQKAKYNHEKCKKK